MRARRRWDRLEGDALKRANARSYANVYLQRGKLKRGPCADCGGPGDHMHHDDYDRPLDVTWLCRPCHGRRHGIELAAA